MQPTVGQAVKWINMSDKYDAEQSWFVQSLSACGGYARISDRPERFYPEARSFCVPVGRLAPEDGAPAYGQPARALVPPSASDAPAGTIGAPRSFEKKKTGVDAPKGDPEFMYEWVRDQGANLIQLQQLRAVIDQPAPNGGVRAMRIRNFIKNHILKEGIDND